MRRIQRYYTWEIWDGGDLVATLIVEKRPEFHRAPWAVLDGDRDILSAHATYAGAIADVTTRAAMIVREGEP